MHNPIYDGLKLDIDDIDMQLQSIMSENLNEQEIESIRMVLLKNLEILDIKRDADIIRNSLPKLKGEIFNLTPHMNEYQLLCRLRLLYPEESIIFIHCFENEQIMVKQVVSEISGITYHFIRYQQSGQLEFIEVEDMYRYINLS